ncbi:MAG: hypothetical protein BGP14_19735 [Sphingobacteriales bacterium 44-15]|nr:MAG: hypothetical protein BGP14_19735 [Sphingobacteriales bacterium 44-15]
MNILTNRYGERVYILIGLSFFLLISCILFIFPLVISIDSIYGFLAYKGTRQTGIFNVLQEVSQQNVATVRKLFVAWWSPGQWMAPAFLQLLFGCRLGIASIIITILSSGLGIYGFYKLYKYFGFSQPVIITSLLILLLSDSFYNSFIIYQGGEVLSFGIFPWFLLFVVKLNKFSWKTSVFFLAFFLLCFVAKTTLVVYCSIIVLYKIAEKNLSLLKGRLNWKAEYNVILCLGLPWLLGCVAIDLFYLQKGLHITFIKEFSPELSDILVPFSSPLSSILSGQTIILRIQKMITGDIRDMYISLSLYFILGVIIVIGIYRASKQQSISSSYLRFLIVLYIAISFFFITGYLFSANIDKNVRHFKLLGFLFIPVFVALFRNINMLKGIVFVFVIYSVSDFIYLKNKWAKNRYVSINYFYRNYYNLEDIDGIDIQTYRKLISLDQSTPLQEQARPIVFFFEGNADIAIDIKHPAVFETEQAKLGAVAYKGKDADVFIIVSKKTLGSVPQFLKLLLPDYREIRKIDETDHYLFFKSE